MENCYIRDYMVNVLEDTFDNEIKKLKYIYYGLEYVLNNIEHNIESNNDTYTCNKLTTCLITIKEILKDAGEENL